MMIFFHSFELVCFHAVSAPPLGRLPDVVGAALPLFLVPNVHAQCISELRDVPTGQGMAAGLAATPQACSSGPSPVWPR